MAGGSLGENESTIPGHLQAILLTGMDQDDFPLISQEFGHRYLPDDRGLCGRNGVRTTSGRRGVGAHTGAGCELKNKIK
jgi:hypothetical protein